MAERMGFEPMKELPLYTLSKRAPSTTRPPLRQDKNFKIVIRTSYRFKKFIIFSEYITEN